MRRIVRNVRVGTDSRFAGDSPEIMGTAISTNKVGKIQVFVRPPERRGLNGRSRFYRVWSESTETLRVIGRLYPDGKFFPLKTKAARDATSTPGWGRALGTMRDTVLAHKVLTE